MLNATEETTSLSEQAAVYLANAKADPSLSLADADRWENGRRAWLDRYHTERVKASRSEAYRVTGTEPVGPMVTVEAWGSPGNWRWRLVAWGEGGRGRSDPHVVWTSEPSQTQAECLASMLATVASAAMVGASSNGEAADLAVPPARMVDPLGAGVRFVAVEHAARAMSDHARDVEWIRALRAALPELLVDPPPENPVSAGLALRRLVKVEPLRVEWVVATQAIGVVEAGRVFPVTAPSARFLCDVGMARPAQPSEVGANLYDRWRPTLVTMLSTPTVLSRAEAAEVADGVAAATLRPNRDQARSR